MRLVSILAARSSQLAYSVALTLVLGGSIGGTASGQFMFEASIEARPYDVDVTPNGLIAVVRANTAPSNLTQGSDHRVSFWRTDVTSSARITPNLPNQVGRGNLTLLTGATGAYAGLGTFSNAIALTNDRAVIIGSADTNQNQIEDTTYVDIVAFDTTQNPPAVVVLQTHALSGTANLPAGLAHDVAITPDGALAVVSHNGWIHVFELTTGGIVAEIPTGTTGSNGSLPAYSRNSLEVTNDFAVVTKSPIVSTTPLAFGTKVYIVDLSYSPPSVLPSLALEHVPEDQGGHDQSAHDLAISPDGTLALVSSHDTVGLYHLNRQGPTYVGGRYATHHRKTNSYCYFVWDSVELSNERAVVLSNSGFGNGGSCGFKQHWRAEVFGISSTALTLVADLDDSSDLGGWIGDHQENQAWDLVMSEDGDFVAIKAAGSDLVVLDVDTAAPYVHRLGGYGAPTGNQFSGSLFKTTAVNDRLNDSVAITLGFAEPGLVNPPPPPATPPEGGVHRWIAFLGKVTTSPPDYSRTVLYDLPVSLLQPQPSPGQWTQVFEHKSPQFATWAVDLSLNLSGTEVLVRDSAPPDESNPALGGRDWHRYDAHSTPAAQLGIPLGGHGYAIGVDNLIQRRGVAVSISAHASLSNYSGHVHVVRTF